MSESITLSIIYSPSPTIFRGHSLITRPTQLYSFNIHRMGNTIKAFNERLRNQIMTNILDKSTINI